MSQLPVLRRDVSLSEAPEAEDRNKRNAVDDKNADGVIEDTPNDDTVGPPSLQRSAKYLRKMWGRTYLGR
jgi:hypothetical protein